MPLLAKTPHPGHSNSFRVRSCHADPPLYANLTIFSDGVHHYDQNGRENHIEEPMHIRRIHYEEVEFVKAWLKEWKSPK